ncbi:hypothetical protein VC273_06025 [Xanthomonas nasturtii]|uniref:hypothetical protein n=1 Tax=Xanthomonas TaxID=338 RepID=UPI002B2340BA|nr:hypothetical protein [Xanthomonas nasturtii]MEA9555494.1 hypothetical protein [Xanthomonas nasturtii]
MKSVFFSAALLPFLIGCASTPGTLVNEPSPGSPAATIVNKLKHLSGKNESTAIFMADGQECGEGPKKNQPPYRALFWMNESMAVQEPKRVTALKPLRFYYREYASLGRKCEIVFDTVLLPEHTYELRGGYEYDEGPIPILTGTRMCRFILVDTTTKQSPPMLQRQGDGICSGKLGQLSELLQLTN